MIYGVKFLDESGGIRHTYEDWGLFQTTPTIVSPPKVQTYYIKVPGRDGALDYTTALDGNVHYESRTFKSTLKCINPRADLQSMYSALLNFLHGKKIRAILDDDPAYYWEGRFEVDEPKWNKLGFFTIDVEGNVDPYKYHVKSSMDDWLWDPFVFETDIAWDYANIEVDTYQEIVVAASDMPTTPIFRLSAPMRMVANGKQEYNLPAGDSTIAGMIINSQEQSFVFYGSGTVTIGFRGGSL